MTDRSLPPDVHRFLTETVAGYGFPVWSELDAVTGADYLRSARASVLPSPDPDLQAILSEDRVISNDIGVRFYQRPDQRDGSPVVVYLHGGGWVMGDLNLNDGWCRSFVQQSGMAMLSVDYRLAPEHPFPVPFEDCYEATRWTVEHATELGCDAAKVVVMGTSAGGNLAAATALRARDEGLQLATQVLVYPVLDAACDTPSYGEFAHGFFLDSDQMRWYWDQYTPSPDDRAAPLASPSCAEHLGGLPPTILFTAELDPLRDEGAEYARRLSGAGVRVDYRCYPGQLHGFLVNRVAFEQADIATGELVSLLLNEFGLAGP